MSQPHYRSVVILTGAGISAESGVATFIASDGLWEKFVSIGTSGSVYPAAGFVAQAKQAGAHTVELNLEPSTNANAFDEGLYGLASDIVPAFFQQLY